MDETSAIIDLEQQSELMTCTQSTALSNVPNTADEAQIWSLYFYGSKYKEGASVGCVLIYPTGNKTFISRRLDFECINNTAEYEALLQGLRKAVDMDSRLK